MKKGAAAKASGGDAASNKFGGAPVTTAFTYTPDKDVQVHKEGAIRLICSAFQSHENGIPEWVKNSADEYVRLEAGADERIIAVIFDRGAKTRAPSISVLDFGGISSATIDDHFRHWASPEAAARGNASASVQGGHGNGGKCYMTMMFDDHALIHTVKAGRGNRYGVASGSVVFGYIPSRATGCDFTVADTAAELVAALKGIGVNVDKLPDPLKTSVSGASGFTLITGRRPHGLGNRIPVDHLVSELLDHPQMLHSIEFANVYVISDGVVVKNAGPLALEPVEPDASFAEPRSIAVPEMLEDPRTGEMVSTTGASALPQGSLVLRTSNVAMTHTRKARHTLIYRAMSGFVGFRYVRTLGVTSGYQNRIYGEIELMSLEPLKQNARQELADAPLSRAVDAFVRREIDALAAEFEARDARTIKQKEKDALSEMNRALDEWKNQFMSGFLGALGGDTTTPPPEPPLPAGIPARMVVELRHTKSGVGVSFRPMIKFFDKGDSRIRPVPFKWVSNDTNVALVDEGLRVINTFSPGRTEISAETENGKLRSNTVELRVLRLRSITLDRDEVEVPSGGRRSVTAICSLASGETLQDVALVWTEGDSTIARVSATGTVFGGIPGVTDVTAGDDSIMAQRPVRVTVVTAREGEDRKPGRGYPMILISEYDNDPETDERVQFSPDEPPVQQRPQDTDRNIWWINSAAPFAQLYLNLARGYGYASREWRIYHIERYIDVIAQIALQADSDIGQMDVNQWLVARGTKIAEIQAAAAAGLGEFIDHGDVSTLR